MPNPIIHQMWSDAVAKLERAERLHRDLFRPEAAGWEPPVDLLETADTLFIMAALPGVRVEDVELVVEARELAIVGVRQRPSIPRPALIHRLELPVGRFERIVRLPAGTFELTRRDLIDGVLTIALRKLG